MVCMCKIHLVVLMKAHQSFVEAYLRQLYVTRGTLMLH